MPIYEYECPKCGRFECEQRVSDKALDAKPNCPEKKCPHSAERVISAPAFHLKGSGWYKTDYSSSSSGSTSGSSSDSSSSGGSSGSDSSSSGGSGGDGDKKVSAPKGKCGSGCGCH